MIFVCLGNICRSPMAAAVLRAGAAAAGIEVVVDSAGTDVWYVGEPADARAQAVLRERGYDDGHGARQFEVADFDRADLVVAMDGDNARVLRLLAPGPDAAAKIRLLRSFDPDAPPGAEVPDPFHASASDFDRCLTLIEAACRGFVAELAKARG